MPGLQYWFSGAGFAAFLALMATTSSLAYGWYRAAVTEMDAASTKIESQQRRAAAERVKSLLGHALEEGGRLLRELPDKPENQATTEAEAWGQRTHDLIEAAYGAGEAAFFLDVSGYTFFNDGSKRSNIRTWMDSDGSKRSNIRDWIDGRMKRITTLIPRAGELPVRADFDLAQFS